MEIEILYFDTAHAIKEHDFIINTVGGSAGYRDIGRLDSVLHHIQNDSYYPTFENKLKHLIYGVVQFHPFTDGNKRSSLVLGAYFLELNGYDYCVDKFLHEMENIVVWLAEGKINDDLLLDIITSIIQEDDYSEDLKLRIIEAVS